MAPSGRASRSRSSGGGGAIEKFLASSQAKTRGGVGKGKEPAGEEEEAAAAAASGAASASVSASASSAQETGRGRRRGGRKSDVSVSQNVERNTPKKAKASADSGRKSGATAEYSVDECLVHVKKLGSKLQGGQEADMLSLQELVESGIVTEKDLREVIDMSDSEVVGKIQEIMLRIAQSIMAGNGYSFDVPSRGSTNQIYIPELDRIVLKDKLSTRHFSSTSTVRKVTIMTRILQLVHQICSRGIHVTKRDLFYTDVKLFQGQDQSDTVLDDVSCLLGCTRSSLHVVASEKGVVVGKLQYNEDGDEIDCTRQGVGGKAIPPHIDKVSNLRSDALFVLLVEKDAAFMRLAEDRFYNRFPCIIITAKGQPDVATRLFLKKVKSDLQIPVLGLVDSDPYGLKILSVYMSGSKNMAYDSSNLTTPDIKWLGVRPSDLNKYKVPSECRLPMTDSDVRTGKELLKEEFITKNPDWVKELELMVSKREKAEIQALSSFGFHYLSEVYLPTKLKNGDWI